MTYEGDASPELADVLSRHDGVLSVDSAMKYLTRDALRWRTDFSLPTVSDLSAATSPKSSI